MAKHESGPYEEIPQWAVSQPPIDPSKMLNRATESMERIILLEALDTSLRKVCDEYTSLTDLILRVYFPK